MEWKNTPGPWKVVQAFGYQIRAADGCIVAKVKTQCPLTSENPANAYLIAAAPELLAACRVALQVLKDQPASIEPVRQALQDAIGRANGQDAEGWMPNHR